MTQSEAILLREELHFLVGQKGVRYPDYYVTDILIVPLNDPNNLNENLFALFADVNVDGKSQLEDIALYSDRRASD